MKDWEVIEAKRVARGISVAELARRVAMEYDALYASLKGKRKILASEFVRLCRELDIRIEDFDMSESFEADAHSFM